MTTAILYLGAWHRGRQSLGIARHYQRRAGGPVSSLHSWLLATSFYLPMIAAVAYYTNTAASHEGDAFHALSLGPEVLWGLAAAAGVCVGAYLLCTIGKPAVPGSGPQSSIEHGGAVVIARWSWGLLRDTGRVLVDASANPGLEQEIREGIEDGDAVITDLHVWQVGPGKFAAIVSLVADEPVSPAEYAARVTIHEELVHVTVETHRCAGQHRHLRAA